MAGYTDVLSLRKFTGQYTNSLGNTQMVLPFFPVCISWPQKKSKSKRASDFLSEA